MAKVHMQAYKVSEIVFNNKVQGKVQLKLNNKVSHNVKYSQNGICEAVMTVEVFDKEHFDVLNVKVTINGVFETPVIFSINNVKSASDTSLLKESAFR